MDHHIIAISERHSCPLSSAGKLQGESSHVPHPPQEGRYHYDNEEDSQAEREQLRETTTRSEVEKRSRGRSSTVESAGGHRHYHWQEVKLEGTTS